MAKIDKKLYDELKKWADGMRQKDQLIKYVCATDRQVADTTVRKLMLNLYKEDIEGEGYDSYYSAKNFYKNMREYFVHIAELYMRHPTEDDTIEEIIESMPATCGWITLILSDMDEIYHQPDIMKELMRALIFFACKRAVVIMVGSDYRTELSGYFNVDFTTDNNILVSDKSELTISIYEQENELEVSSEIFESENDEREALEFYWRILHRQQKHHYFDYTYFKVLFLDTWKYFIPRVTTENVNRRDLRLIGLLFDTALETWDNTDGCERWEYEATLQFAKGLYYAIVNDYGENDDLSSGELSIGLEIEEKTEKYEWGEISGCAYHTIKVLTENFSEYLDKLADAIRQCTYGGKDFFDWLKYTDFDKSEE